MQRIDKTFVRTIQRNYHAAFEFIEENLPEAQLAQKEYNSEVSQLHLAGAGIFQWFGETQAKYDNTTAEGRAKNRRVNVAIVPNEKMVRQAKQAVK